MLAESSEYSHQALDRSRPYSSFAHKMMIMTTSATRKIRRSSRGRPLCCCRCCCREISNCRTRILEQRQASKIVDLFYPSWLRASRVGPSTSLTTSLVVFAIVAAKPRSSVEARSQQADNCCCCCYNCILSGFVWQLVELSQNFASQRA